MGKEFRSKPTLSLNFHSVFSSFEGIFVLLFRSKVEELGALWRTQCSHSPTCQKW